MTTPEVIDAVLKVFAGSVNAELVTAFRAAGARPVGLSGLDAGLVDAELLNPELGQVGKPVHSDARLLDLLTAGIVSVRWSPASPEIPTALYTTSMQIRWPWPARRPSQPNPLSF